MSTEVILTYDKLFTMLEALDKIEETTVEFKNISATTSLFKAKQEIDVHVKAFRLKNKPSVEYQKCITEANHVKRTLEGDELKTKLKEIDKKNSELFKKEEERRIHIEEELQKEVTIFVDLINIKDLTSKTVKDMAFVFAIGPLIKT